MDLSVDDAETSKYRYSAFQRNAVGEEEIWCLTFFLNERQIFLVKKPVKNRDNDDDLKTPV